MIRRLLRTVWARTVFVIDVFLALLLVPSHLLLQGNTFIISTFNTERQVTSWYSPVAPPGFDLKRGLIRPSEWEHLCECTWHLIKITLRLFSWRLYPGATYNMCIQPCGWSTSASSTRRAATSATFRNNTRLRKRFLDRTDEFSISGGRYLKFQLSGYHSGPRSSIVK